MITVTGMEASGTRALRNLVAEMTNEEVRHISWPNGGLEWGPSYVEGQKVIIIVRRPDIRNQSAISAGHVQTLTEADTQWCRGIAVMSGIPGALWIAYEALTGNQEIQIQNIADYLGVPHPRNHMQWKDANDKYRR